MPDYHTESTSTLEEMTGWLAADIKIDPKHVVTWAIAVMTRNPDEPNSPYGFVLVRLLNGDDMPGNSLMASSIINATLEHMNDGQE